MIRLKIFNSVFKASLIYHIYTKGGKNSNELFFINVYAGAFVGNYASYKILVHLEYWASFQIVKLCKYLA